MKPNIQINVAAATRSFNIDHSKIVAIATEFMHYALKTKGLAMIYNKEENTLYLIEDGFEELSSNSSTN